MNPSSSLISWNYLFSRPRMINNCVNFVHPWIASALLSSQRLMQVTHPGIANLKATDATLVSAPTPTKRRATGTVVCTPWVFYMFVFSSFHYTTVFLPKTAYA